MNTQVIQPATTDVENVLIGLKLDALAALIKEVRTSNPNPTVFYLVSIQLNVPLLFVICELLRRKHPGKKLVMLGRDCQLMEKVYRASFSTNCAYLPFSRVVANKQPDLAIEYLNKALGSNGVLVDISSTGDTWQKLSAVQEFPITAVVYGDVPINGKPLPVPPSTFSYLTKNSEVPTNILIEIFNCGDHGMLSDIKIINDQTYLTWAADELPKPVIEEVQRAVLDTVRRAKNYPTVAAELASLDDAALLHLCKNLLANLCAQTVVYPVLIEFVMSIQSVRLL